jgi:uncharacterized protein YbjT (DUF2867 family)
MKSEQKNKSALPDLSGERPLVVITGATGYIGGRLLKALDTERYQLRCIARRPEYLRERVDSAVEVVQGDVLDKSSLDTALRGAHTAFYMVHSMGSTGDFEEEDRKAASNFGGAAKASGVKRIIYLGGLGDASQPLSTHLRSRHEVGTILRQSGVPVIEFRASVVIGSGSLSFELVRALTERLPIMLTPKWVSAPAQPIGIEDLIEYLVRAVDVAVDGSPIYQIGGKDVVSYGDLMKLYARERNLKRLMIPVPVLTPYLSSLWITIFAPIYQRIGRKLIMSLRHPTVVTDDTARKTFGIKTLSVREAIARAIQSEDQEFAETRWSDALSSIDAQRDWGGVRFGNRLIESRSRSTKAEPARAFAVLRRIGGKNGWYYADWLWQIRGALDILMGGVGMRRGRRDPEQLRTGDVVDCWRVEKIVPDGLIRFTAEMKLPGRAWLEFELEKETSRTIIRQTAIFDPIGLSGLVYWYVLYPMHKLIFSGMIQNIAALCDKDESSRT